MSGETLQPLHDESEIREKNNDDESSCTTDLLAYVPMLQRKAD